MILTKARTGRTSLWLFSIIGIGLALRMAAILLFNHAPESDELAYQSMARNLLLGNGVIDQMGNRAMYNVGYPLFVLSPMFALFGENLFPVRLLNALLGGAAIALCYATAREAGAGKAGSLLAALIWALYLPANVYVVYLAKENLMIPLMLGVIWCALRMLKTPSFGIALVCGLLLGLLALTGNAALVLILPVAFVLLVASISLERKFALLILIVSSAALVTAPWLLRNSRELGAAVLNTNGGFNLYLGNNASATGMFMSITDTPRGSSWESLRRQGEVQASEALKRDAITWIKENPATFLALAAKKAVYFWTPPLHQGKGAPSRGESALRSLWAIQFIVLVAAALASLLFAKGSRHTVVLWLAIGSYTAVHMLFYVIFRYREPIMPIIGMLSALTLVSLWSRMRPLSIPR